MGSGTAFPLAEAALALKQKSDPMPRKPRIGSLFSF